MRSLLKPQLSQLVSCCCESCLSSNYSGKSVRRGPHLDFLCSYRFDPVVEILFTSPEHEAADASNILAAFKGVWKAQIRWASLANLSKFHWTIMAFDFVLHTWLRECTITVFLYWFTFKHIHMYPLTLCTLVSDACPLSFPHHHDFIWVMEKEAPRPASIRS